MLYAHSCQCSWGSLPRPEDSLRLQIWLHHGTLSQRTGSSSQGSNEFKQQLQKSVAVPLESNGCWQHRGDSGGPKDLGTHCEEGRPSGAVWTAGCRPKAGDRSPEHLWEKHGAGVDEFHSGVQKVRCKDWQGPLFKPLSFFFNLWDTPTSNADAGSPSSLVPSPIQSKGHNITHRKEICSIWTVLSSSFMLFYNLRTRRNKRRIILKKSSRGWRRRFGLVKTSMIRQPPAVTSWIWSKSKSKKKHLRIRYFCFLIILD